MCLAANWSQSISFTRSPWKWYHTLSLRSIIGGHWSTSSSQTWSSLLVGSDVLDEIIGPSNVTSFPRAVFQQVLSCFVPTYCYFVLPKQYWSGLPMRSCPCFCLQSRWLRSCIFRDAAWPHWPTLAFNKHLCSHCTVNQSLIPKGMCSQEALSTCCRPYRLFSSVEIYISCHGNWIQAHSVYCLCTGVP